MLETGEMMRKREGLLTLRPLRERGPKQASISPSPGIGVDARIRARAQHAGLGIYNDAGVRSNRPRTRNTQSVTALDKCRLRRLWDARLDSKDPRIHGVSEL